jgi:hypothetical protein
LLDLLVEVVEGPPDPLGEIGSERRLPGAHEPDQGDVPV